MKIGGIDHLGLAVRSAEDVSRGGCRVTSGSGLVDMRIETQVELIEQALFEKAREEGPEEAAGGRGLPEAAGSPAAPSEGREEKERSLSAEVSR